MRLRTTLFGLLVVISIILSGTVYAGFALHKGDIAAQEEQELRIAANSVAEDLHSRIHHRESTVAIATQADGVAAFGTAAQDRALREFLNESGFQGASVTDLTGTVTAIAVTNLNDSAERGLVGSDLSHRTYVRRALNGSVSVSRPVEAESGNDIVTVSAPIRRGGELVGTFNAALHLSRTGLFDSSLSLLESSQHLTVRAGDRVLFGANETTGTTVTDTVQATGWEVTVSQDPGAVQERLWTATTAQAGAVALAILSVALVGVWVSRTTVDQLRQLIGGLNRLESGDYDAEMDLGVTDEWVHISRQFNALAETLRQRESQLRVLNRVLRHNLRNDMSVVIAHCDTLLHNDADGSATDEDQLRKIRDTAENLAETSEHARSIYEQLLTTGDADRHPVDVAAVVDRQTSRLAADYPAASVDTRLPAHAWAVDGDAIPIVVDELCRNALMHNDAPEADRRLTVTVEREAEDVRLEVRDNGPGLPAVEAELLRGDREETDIEHGSGLGLWVVTWLVEQLDGDLDARTPADGGTTVVVRFPATEPPADGADGDDGPDPAAGGSDPEQRTAEPARENASDAGEEEPGDDPDGQS